MNGPFIALGMLMTFMAAAVFAVSSTSRSTQVGSSRTADRQVYAIRTSKRSETTMVAVERESCHVSDLEAAGCERRTTTRLEAARICVANDCMAQWQEEALDCRSHYDAVYDRAVYGPKNIDFLPARILDRTGESTVVGGEEMVDIFRSVFAQHGQPLPARAMRKKHDSDPTVTWTEYVGFMVTLEKAPIVSMGGTEASNEFSSVRSGDWLRHSAALALNRVGGLLQSAAMAVEPTGCE